MKSLPLPWSTLFGTSSSPIIEPAGGWNRTAGIADMRATLEMRGRMGDVEVEIGVEVANVENDPLSLITLTGYKNTNGVHYPTAWVSMSSGFEGKQLWRPAFRVKNASSVDLNLVRAAGVIEIVNK